MRYTFSYYMQSIADVFVDVRGIFPEKCFGNRMVGSKLSHSKEIEGLGFVDKCMGRWTDRQTDRQTTIEMVRY